MKQCVDDVRRRGAHRGVGAQLAVLVRADRGDRLHDVGEVVGEVAAGGADGRERLVAQGLPVRFTQQDLVDTARAAVAYLDEVAARQGVVGAVADAPLAVALVAVAHHSPLFTARR